MYAHMYNVMIVIVYLCVQLTVQNALENWIYVEKVQITFHFRCALRLLQCVVVMWSVLVVIVVVVATVVVVINAYFCCYKNTRCLYINALNAHNSHIQLSTIWALFDAIFPHTFVCAFVCIACVWVLLIGVVGST